MQKIAAFILMVGVLLMSAVSNSVAAGTADSQSAPTSTPAEAPETTNQPSSASEIHEHFASIRTSDLSDVEKCVELQKYNWLLIKMGNLDARYSAYHGLLEDWYYIDGRPRDRLSLIRDITIYEFHSFGSSGMRRDMAHTSPQVFWQNLIRWQPYFAQRRALRDCILVNGPTQECTAVAVREKLIPSFEEFVAEIDQSLAHGSGFMCDGNFKY